MWSVIKRLALGVALILAASAVLLWSDTTRRRPSRQRSVQVAILQHASQPPLDEGVEGMIQGLAASGYEEGRNLTIRRYNAEGDLPTANTIAKEITGGGHDLLMTASTLSLQAVANANSAGKTPHVFALVSDPAATGVGIRRDAPLDHPPHLAGYGTMQPVEQTFELAKKMFPDLTVVGEVWNPAEANSEAQTKIARDVSRRLGIELLEANAENASAVVEAAGSLVARGAQAIWVGGDVTVLAALDALIPLARQAGIPVFTSMPGRAGRGTLFDLGADYREVGRLAGELAGQVLGGRDPATVAIENVLPEKLVIDEAALAGLHDPWRFTQEMRQLASRAPATQPRAAGPVPGRTYRLGLVYFAPEPGVETCMRGLFDGLKERGFVEGENLEVLRAHAQGEIANIPALFQNFETEGLDVVVPMSTPCLTAACGAVRTSPVVFTYVYDPIAAGAGTSFDEHHPNVTGVGSFPPVEDTAALLVQLLPGVKTVGTIYNSSEANSRKVVSVAREVFAARGLELAESTVVNSSEIFQAAQALVSRGVDVLWIAGDNTAIQGFDGIVKVANDAKLPLVTSDVEPVAHQGLATIGVGFYEPGYAAGQLAARVLAGERPADLPFENVSVKTVTLNLAVARRLGIRVPDDVRESAAAIVDEHGVHEQAVAKPQQAPPARPHAPLAKKWKLDLLEFVNVLDVEDAERGIRAGLGEAGLVEGRDFELTIRNAQGDMPTLPALVDAAVTGGSDLLLTLSTPTLQAAMQRAGDLPIVFTFVASAVAAGAARSNDDHAPNVTGVPTMGAYQDLMETVHDCLPGARRVGTLFVPAEVNSVHNKDELVAAARRYGVEVVAVAANTSAEIADAALALVSHDIDAVVQVSGNLTSAAFASIAQAARRTRMPLFGSLSSHFHDGAPVAVARDYFDGGREAALLAARILRGEDPARIPLQPLVTTRTLVDADAARAFGLVVPASVLQRAAASASARGQE